MPRVVVVLVEPKNEGNVGAIARAMRNFSIDSLVLVNPCPIGDEAYQRAMHGRSVLESAKVVTSLAEAIEGTDLVAGTTGIATQSEKKFRRIALAPREFAERVRALDGTLALLNDPTRRALARWGGALVDLGVTEETLAEGYGLSYARALDDFATPSSQG